MMDLKHKAPSDLGHRGLSRSKDAETAFGGNPTSKFGASVIWALVVAVHLAFLLFMGARYWGHQKLDSDSPPIAKEHGKTAAPVA